MDHFDNVPEELKKLLETIFNLPYNVSDMEDAYEVGRKAMLKDLMEYKQAVVANYGLMSVINLDKAQEEIEELLEE